MAINVSVPSTRIKGLMSTFANVFTNRLNTDPDRERLSMVMGFHPSKNNARDETSVRGSWLQMNVVACRLAPSLQYRFPKFPGLKIRDFRDSTPQIWGPKSQIAGVPGPKL